MKQKTTQTLTQCIKNTALANGADLVGVADIAELSDQSLEVDRLLPDAHRVAVVISRHSPSALESSRNQVRQLDTIFTYGEAERAAHFLVRALEDAGHRAVAVPAFIPIDMKSPRNGMRGDISWRDAGVQAGLGSWGENGLLVTSQFGSAIRICGVVTDAQLECDTPLKEDACDHCLGCIQSCPTKALLGGGRIDKKKCGDHIFRYGFRTFQGFMSDLFDRNKSAREVINGFALRELWQNFMIGNYYYCFRCQTQCHKAPKDQTT